MAGKISDLPALTGANLASNDKFEVDDVSATTSKSITAAELVIGLGADHYLGTWNASTNSPTLVSSTGGNGGYYQVSTAGTTTLDGISSWAVGDFVFFNGSVWLKFPGNTNLRKPWINPVFCFAFTPAGTGADAGWFLVPYDPLDGSSSLTYTIERIDVWVSTPGGAPAVTVERSHDAGSTWATIGTVTLGSGAGSGSKTSSFTTGTVVSGDLLRMNVGTLGTATGWTVSMQASA